MILEVEVIRRVKEVEDGIVKLYSVWRIEEIFVNFDNIV